MCAHLPIISTLCCKSIAFFPLTIQSLLDICCYLLIVCCSLYKQGEVVIANIEPIYGWSQPFEGTMR